MSRYEWQELINGWEKESLSAEQVIGQLLLWGQEMATQLQQLSAQFAVWQRHLEINEARVERLERPPRF